MKDPFRSPPPNLPPEQEPNDPKSAAEQKRRNWLHFTIGFAAWFIVNGLFWVFFPLNENFNNFNVVLTMPANIIALVILASNKRTRWIGFGILTAITVNLVITLVQGMFSQAPCLIPFFSGELETTG